MRPSIQYAMATFIVASGLSANCLAERLRGLIVTGECSAPLEKVRVSVSYRGKTRTNIASTDGSGYFEIDLAEFFPDWSPAYPIGLSFEKRGYLTKHRNLQNVSSQIDEVPLEKERGGQPEESPYASFAEHRKDSCGSWTVFAVPHKADADVMFPDYDQAQEMHFRLSTHFQQLDLPLEKVPGITVEWLEQARNLSLSSDDVSQFGSYLNGLGVLYGNVKAKHVRIQDAEPLVSSYMQIISTFRTRIGQTKVAQRVPLDRLDEEIYAQNGDYIANLTSTTLLAVVARELDRATRIPNRPDYHTRLNRIRDFILAERKNFPKQEAQSPSQRSNFHVLNQLIEIVDKAMIEGSASPRSREIVAQALE